MSYYLKKTVLILKNSIRFLLLLLFYIILIMKEIQIGDLVYFKNQRKSPKMIVFKLLNYCEGFPLVSVNNRVVHVMVFFNKINKCFTINIYESSLTVFSNEFSQTDYM